MFTDWQAALEAEALPLSPSPIQQLAAAARVTARRADSQEEDLALLLDVLGLPGDDATLTVLLPHLPSPEGAPDMPEHQQPLKTVSAFEAMALSMYYTDSPTAEITAATGLSEDEITALVTAQERQFDTDETAGTTTPQPTASGSAGGSVEQLLAWAEAHPAAAIRNKAARVRGDLAELTSRRAADDAQHQAEQRVARLKSELEQAQETLRAVKAGARPALAAAPVPAVRKRSKEQLAAIRTWARATGRQVADRGNPAKAVLDAYDAAHRTSLAEAS
ncbi:hypothetical protein DT019_27310 [Streptomyces sp. SDr-06]|uniref:Lsr2 family DNA-binding protein n=1 Tax=Streptomyces sp. SDr-06 TaxID=2267702 RepID=UPI000DE855E6|nr:Lsr2 family protein [Streptomyces sp. SDr-06]RCH65503.1 hypothetical protein DT019_27310 [Streptomyces sp. SDr-06]